MCKPMTSVASKASAWHAEESPRTTENHRESSPRDWVQPITTEVGREETTGFDPETTA